MPPKKTAAPPLQIATIRTTTFGSAPPDATPAERALHDAHAGINSVLVDIPAPGWCDDARDGRAEPFRIFTFRRAGDPEPDTATPHGRVMHRARAAINALACAVDRLRSLPAPLRGESLAGVETALDDLTGLQLGAGWEQAGGDFEAWAGAVRPWFEKFGRDHAGPLRRASKRLEDLLRDPEALRAYEPAPPPTPDLPRKREDALWALHRANAFSVEAKASKAEIRKKNPELDPNTLRYNLRKLEDAGLVAKGESGRGWYLTPKGEAHIRHLQEKG